MMFSVMELRVIRTSVKKTMEELIKRKGILDPESDDAVEITNDLMMYQNIIEKINDREEV
ncbi:hypothetical protein [Thalassomonas actiniarum]|uniref:Uncharacterized protein n=1 Tax=Thalassomonas actiniarum TaxID=485447 RepID=A0AAF0C2I4_9GAMM|nr:hypothetical protein [Thalassomonas actiniarum]WDD97885.1 hypothetical protein SG35_021720 [Thalassomonas actiniarum]